MSNAKRNVNICQYHVKKGHEAEMEALLAKHWTTLRKVGLASEDPPLDWSPTPLNITLQILAVALFIGVVWFIVSSFFGGFSEVLSR